MMDFLYSLCGISMIAGVVGSSSRGSSGLISYAQARTRAIGRPSSTRMTIGGRSAPKPMGSRMTSAAPKTPRPTDDVHGRDLINAPPLQLGQEGSELGWHRRDIVDKMRLRSVRRQGSNLWAR